MAQRDYKRLPPDWTWPVLAVGCALLGAFIVLLVDACIATLAQGNM